MYLISLFFRETSSLSRVIRDVTSKCVVCSYQLVDLKLEIKRHESLKLEALPYPYYVNERCNAKMRHYKYT